MKAIVTTKRRVHTHCGARAAIVEGGALEIRVSSEGTGIGDYRVVIGYAPGVWSSFVNDETDDG